MVTKLSQPDALINVCVAVPAAVSVLPYQLNGNWLVQIVAVVSPVKFGLTTKVRVTTLSQPDALINVCVAVPAAVSVLPYQLNGNWLVQIVAVVSPVKFGLTTKVRVTTLSQPDALINVCVAVPAAVSVLPYQLNGNWLVQIVAVVSPVKFGLTTKVRVTTLSQPDALINVCVAVPAAVSVLPYQLNGNWLVQIVAVVSPVKFGLTTKVRVTTLSQPDALINVCVAVPAAVRLLPYQLNGNWLVQIVAVVSPVKFGLTTKVRVTTLSQPDALINVCVAVPAAVSVLPYQLNGNWLVQIVAVVSPVKFGLTTKVRVTTLSQPDALINVCVAVPAAVSVLPYQLNGNWLVQIVAVVSPVKFGLTTKVRVTTLSQPDALINVCVAVPAAVSVLPYQLNGNWLVQIVAVVSPVKFGLTTKVRVTTLSQPDALINVCVAVPAAVRLLPYQLNGNWLVQIVAVVSPVKFGLTTKVRVTTLSQPDALINVCVAVPAAVSVLPYQLNGNWLVQIVAVVSPVKFGLTTKVRVTTLSQPDALINVCVAVPAAVSVLPYQLNGNWLVQIVAVVSPVKFGLTTKVRVTTLSQPDALINVCVAVPAAVSVLPYQLNGNWLVQIVAVVSPVKFGLTTKVRVTTLSQPDALINVCVAVPAAVRLLPYQLNGNWLVQIVAVVSPVKFGLTTKVRVTTLSQPDALINVCVAVPAAVSVLPYQLNGNWLVQIVAVVSPVKFGLTTKVRVTTLSQPDALINVCVAVPAAVSVLPYQLNGNWLVQIVAVVSPVKFGLTTKVRVTTLSQPDALINVCVAVPAAVRLLPYQLNGNWLVQIVAVVSPVKFGLTTKVRVTTLSQPDALINVCVAVPAAVSVLPYQLNGNWLVQIVAVVSPVKFGLTTKVRVTTLSQPDALINVCVAVPAAVRLLPYQLNGNWLVQIVAVVSPVKFGLTTKVRVTTLSQPDALINVCVAVPAAVRLLPYQLNGNWLVQIVAVVSPVKFGLTTKVRVTTLSQPDALINVCVAVPAAVRLLPYQLNGNWLVQIVAVVSPVKFGLTTKVRVTTLSQPDALINVCVAVPAAVSVLPYQLNGNWLVQIVAVVSPVKFGLTTKVRVTTLSQPDALINVCVAVPAAVRLLPYQLNGNWLVQIVAVVSPVKFGLTTKVRVTTLSQPDALINVCVAVPAAVSVLPYQLNGNWLVQIVAVVSPVKFGLTTKVRVTTLSQPDALINVCVAVPAAVSVLPYQLNGSWL